MNERLDTAIQFARLAALNLHHAIGMSSSAEPEPLVELRSAAMKLGLDIQEFQYRNGNAYNTDTVELKS